MKHVQVDSPFGVLHGVRGGQGPTLVLLHANGLSSAEFERVMPLLAPHCDVIAWDQPGHGHAGADTGACSNSGRVTDCSAALDLFLAGLGVERATLAGSSIGAFVAVDLARRRPDRVSGVSLIEAQWRTRVWWQERWPLVEKMFATPMLTREQVAARVTGPVEDSLLQSWNRDRQRAGPQLMLDVMRSLAEYDLGAALAGLSTPLQLVYGERSPTVDNASVLHAQRADAALVIIEAAGHYPALDAPAMLARHLLEFTNCCARAEQ